MGAILIAIANIDFQVHDKFQILYMNIDAFLKFYLLYTTILIRKLLFSWAKYGCFPLHSNEQDAVCANYL